MCGIVGYIGNDDAVPVLLHGLKTLEYRGYDSAGIAVVTKGRAAHIRRVGRVHELEKACQESRVRGRCGIGHTRWATHGVPNETNAHPHADCTGRIFVVHNGIIENHADLRRYLTDRGHHFSSQTDTEVVAHLIEEFLKDGRDMATAFSDALKMITGAYALVVLDMEHPDVLYAARLSSPLIVGVGNGAGYVASDPAALLAYTKQIIFLNDGQIAEVSAQGVRTTDLAQQPTPFEVVTLEWDLEQVKKGNYPHFMLKEIHEAPDVIKSALRGRIVPDTGMVKLGGLEQVRDQLTHAQRVLILACGTSYYAGLLGEYLFEEIAGIPTEVQVASEFRYRNEPLEKGTVALAISQSGETADTLAALRKVKEHGLLTLGLVNVVGSSIARETDAGVYNHAGPEIGVASTKAFMSQLTVLVLMAAYMAQERHGNAHSELVTALAEIPKKLGKVLKHAPALSSLAKEYVGFENFLYIGRRFSYPVALEGALKLKEISYVHAEGYSAGEMKHGPIAMISPDFPTVAVVPRNDVAEKMYSNLEEVKARRGRIIAIATEGDTHIGSIADDVVYIPHTHEVLQPLLAIVPLQLFAYHIGVARGYDVDKPRNLAKSVTVE